MIFCSVFNCRANHLKARNFSFLGRVKNIKSVIKERILQSKQMGARENKLINTEGRIQFDLLLVLIRDYKLRSYTLNAVSYHFLQVLQVCLVKLQGLDKHFLNFKFLNLQCLILIITLGTKRRCSP